MKLKGKNNSSVKTKKLIKQAFAELMKEKMSITNITVTELVNRIDITRGAFYSHYDNIYDVAEEFESELQSVAFNGISELKTNEDVFKYIEELFNYLIINEDLYRKLLKSDDTLFFMNNLTKKLFKEVKNIGINIEDYDLKMTFYTNGATSLLIKYFRDEINISLNDIKNYLQKTFTLIFT